MKQFFFSSGITPGAILGPFQIGYTKSCETFQDKYSVFGRTLFIDEVGVWHIGMASDT